MTDKNNIIQFPSQDMRLECECGCQAFAIKDDGSVIYCLECDLYYVLEETIEMDEGA